MKLGVHPAFKPLFGPAAFHPDASQHDALRDTTGTRLRGMFVTADRQLGGRDWFAGFRSFVDPYLYILLRWTKPARVDLSGLDRLHAFIDRMQADAGVQAALRAEGLKPV